MERESVCGECDRKSNVSNEVKCKAIQVDDCVMIQYKTQ